MTNPSRSIHSSAPQQHRNFHKFLLLFLIIYSAVPSATAQMSTNSSPSSGSSSSGVNPSIVIVIVVIFLAFFIMLFLSICIRYCNTNPATSGAAAAARPPSSKPGLDPKVINTFPTFHYSDVKDFKFGEGRGTLECAVCIAEFVNDDAMRLLPKCEHVFHPDCIDAWLASHSTCPVCRADLTPSKNDLEKWTRSTQSNDLDRSENQNRSQSQNQDQIAVEVLEEGGSREVQASELQKTKLVPRAHSTGHSLSHPGEDLERYTLRLPVELRREMMSPPNGNLKRTISCVVGKTIDERSRKGGGGEERSGRGRSDRWVLTMAPPSLSRAPLVASPKVGFEGDLTAVGDLNRSFLATVRTPFECLTVKRDGVGQTSTRPIV